jgi:excisionase family DNA binding protein
MYSTKEAAKKLGLSQAHVKLLARKGLIQAQKVGRDWIVLDLNYTRKRQPKGGRNLKNKGGDK